MVKKSGDKLYLSDKSEKHKSHSNQNIENLLIENFVSLQKVMADMAQKFDLLSNQLSQLLNLFELSAKTFVEKTSAGGIITKEDKELINRLDKLMDQNKTIAKALTLMEERVRGKPIGQENTFPIQNQFIPNSQPMSNNDTAQNNPYKKQLPRF